MPNEIGLEAGREAGAVSSTSQNDEQKRLSAVLWQWLTPTEGAAVERMLSAFGQLSDKEWALVELLCQAHSNTAVANLCHLSRRTIDNYVTHLFHHLGFPDKNGPISRNLILLKAYQIYSLGRTV